MEKQFEFSVVVFWRERNELYKTYKSICDNTPAGFVQILAVCTGDEGTGDEDEAYTGEEEYLQILEKDKNLIRIDGKECENIAAEIRKHVSGKYLIFTKAGILFSSGTAENICKCFELEKRDIVISRIYGKHNIHVREHNDYCTRFNSETTLDNAAYLMHQIYSAYTFTTDKFRWPEKIEKDTWYFDILDMVYRNVVSCESLGISADSIGIRIPREELTFEDWKNMMSDPEELDAFFEKFLKKLIEYRLEETVRHEQNADYVLMYYVSKTAETLFRESDITEENVRKYEQYIDRFLKQLKFPEIIISNQHISKANKIYLLQKYFPDIDKNYSEQANRLLTPIYNNIWVKIFQQQKEVIHCEFSVFTPKGVNNGICMMTDERKYEAKEEYVLKYSGWCREESAEEKLYVAEIPLKDIRKFICWGIEVNGHTEKMRNITYGKYAPFTKKLPLFLHVQDKFLYLKPAGSDQNNLDEAYEICAEPYSKRRETKLRRKLTRALLSCGKAGVKAVLVRRLYERKKKNLKKRIWLISDRTTRGDDNGEVMFRYLCANPDPTVEPYFVVNKDTEDYKEMGKLGKVVEPFSWNHKMLFLLNEFSLSSQANKPVINPFGRLEYLYRDIIYDKKLVFLQHGVTKDNQSKWLNKYNRNLFGFVVSTKPEYDSVFEYDYYYPPQNVWLTGMPRYDRLIHDEKKYVTVMPTWRKSLSSGTDARGVWQLGKEFADSEYFHFYDDLLNNEKLLNAAEKYGYTICFMPHPNTIDGLDMFRQDSRVKFMDSSYSYKDIFAQTDLMITDYSSVAFDFAYLRKPIVYSQFDRESFFSGAHSYTEGYFDYERDGFGEVEHTLEGTVNRIIEYMSNDCRMKEKYQKRMDETFAFNDRNCSRRVYEKIIENRK